MKKRHLVYLIVCVQFLLSLAVLSAQSNKTLDSFLEEERASYGYSAYMLLASVGDIPDASSPQEAMEALSEKEWALAPREAGEAITLGEYSSLLMSALDIDGGIMYKLFPGPRYAARELKHLDLLPGKPIANRYISGREAVHILGRVLQWKEERS